MSSRLLQTLDSHRLFIFRLWFLFWALCLGLQAYQSYSNYVSSYSSFPISDWLINYQGGFVRRGLVGEILYQLYQWTPFSVHDVIACFYLITFFILLYALYRLFKSEGWSLLLFISPLLIIPVFAYVAFWTRRDYFSLLLTWGIFKFYFQFIQSKNKWSYFWMQLLMISTLLVHEAAFFYTIPILMFHYGGYLHAKQQKLLNVFLKVILTFSGTLITLYLVSYYKGNVAIANTIWESWKPCMLAYPLENTSMQMGLGVEALTWDALQTFKNHFFGNFGGYFISFIPAWPFVFYCYMAVYYLVTRLNTVDLKMFCCKAVQVSHLSNVLLVQFICMLPMMLVLSCDTGRVISYWIVTTLVFYHYSKIHESCWFSAVTPVTMRLQRCIDRVSWLANPWVYFLIIFTLPLNPVLSPRFYAMPPITILYSLWALVQSFLH